MSIMIELRWSPFLLLFSNALVYTNTLVAVPNERNTMGITVTIIIIFIFIILVFLEFFMWALADRFLLSLN